MRAWLLLLAIAAQAREIRIGVLELFHPTVLRVQASSIAIGEERIVLHSEVTLTLEPGAAILCRVGGRELRGIRATVEGPEVTVSIPNRITRSYRGRLEVRITRGALEVVVVQDLEEAVASSVGAEMPAAPIEALRAQAIAARSYYLGAQHRHEGYDFCDTTHCQWLQGTRAPSHPAAGAAKGTAGQVLTHRGSTLAAMYFRSCGGRTLRAADVRLSPDPYPYFAVDCEACRRSPATWEARLAAKDAARLVKEGPSEALRLELARRIGWNRLASNSYVTEPAASDVVFKGKGHGHGVGMCQRGAIGMARSGAKAELILSHYYPDTTVRRVQ